MDPSAVAEQAGTTPPSPARGPAAPTAPPDQGASPTGLTTSFVVARDRLRRVMQAGPIGWAAFLATSWTWCIGMFLPVLFLRDYGGWGWVLFAVPNIVGAAAMGWTLRDPEASRVMQQAHGPACRAFSLVTMAFHAFFVIALVPRLLGDEVIWLTAVCVPPFVLLLHGRGRGGRRATVSAAAVLALSVVVMLAVLALRGLPTFPPPAKGRLDLLWLAPVTIFGFLLDPYLDLTFHRARQSTTRAGGRTAFGLGFGVFFLVMVVFTVVYAPVLILRINALAMGQRLPPSDDLFDAVLVVHLSVQAAFTIAAHADALRAWGLVGPGPVVGGPVAAGPAAPEPVVAKPAGAKAGRGVPGWIIALAVVTALAVPLRLVQDRFPVYHGLSTGEVIYRMFLAFYGLVFPAYVWLFAVPRRLRGGGRARTDSPTRGQILFFAAVVVLAAPLFWMSFIEGRMGWAVPGLVLVLVARFLLPKPALPGPGAIVR